MSTQDVQTLRGAYEAFARQDIPAVLSAFHEDIRWTDPESMPFGGTYTGHEEVMGFFGKLPEYWQELEVVPEEFVDGGETIVVLGRVRGAGARGRVDQRFAHVWRMSAGRADSFEELTDTAKVLEAIGTPAVAGG